MDVQITVLVKEEGRTRLSSRTVRIDSERSDKVASRVVTDMAKIVGEEAMFGHLLPTRKEEGG